jgi:hypothetical protein
MDYTIEGTGHFGLPIAGRVGKAAQAMSVINNLIVGLVLEQGVKYLPMRRKYSAHPLEG